MKTVQRTDVGKIRKVNEDRAIVQEHLHGFTLAMLADGMGGHQAGDIASQVAIDTVHRELQSMREGMSADECKFMLRTAVEAANAAVYELGNSKEQFLGMGTTFVAALAAAESVVVGHIGDSRAYKINSEGVTQLTEDHSYVNELLKSGQITEDEAVQHPRRNVVTRALGTEPHVDVDVFVHEWKPGDNLLLCSDGLTDLVDPETIQRIMQGEDSLERKADELIAMALAAGGDDNVTVVLLENDSEADAGEGE